MCNMTNIKFWSCEILAPSFASRQPLDQNDGEEGKAHHCPLKTKILAIKDKLKYKLFVCR